MAVGDTVLVQNYSGNGGKGCVNDEAYKKAAEEQKEAIIKEAVVWAAIQVALMAMKRSTQTAIADMQAELADRRVRLAEELLAHAQLTWEKEKAFVTEVMSEALHVTSYAEADVIAAELDRTEDLALGVADADAECLGLTMTACDDAYMKGALAGIRTDLIGHTMRTAEARTIQLNDRRYSRQLAAIGMGRGRLQQALQIGQMGAAGADAVRNSLMRTINSGMELWGYVSNRWQHGGNYATGPNGAPRVVRDGVPMLHDGRYAPPSQPLVVVQQTADPRADENGVYVPTLAGSPVDSFDGAGTEF